ncbi:hypothetical protein [Streptomyces sp. NPDC017958]|uniref:hypothetical protein n=1 Tax=Streptomyces sp. NPDC017958 TaxID=3365021 RepID=UPI0037BB24C7
MNTTAVGTSQAAAHVAGLAAYLLSTSKDLTPATVGEAITILAVPDRLLDLPVGSRTCWRSTTRRPADHLRTEGTSIVGSADYAAAFALVAQQRLQTPTTTDDLATDAASQDLADRIAHFAGAGLLDTDNPRLAADHFSALTVLLAYERQPIPATASSGAHMSFDGWISSRPGGVCLTRPMIRERSASVILCLRPCPPRSSRQARSIALSRLATEIPAAILVRTVGIHTDVAVAWQRLSAGDWTNYVAQVSQRINQPHQHGEGDHAPR